ncbi:MAG TPA: response regulator [Thermoanaerobaculia bacterium]|nr:response regulator [Thermoanaerobaculia bacterium]
MTPVPRILIVEDDPAIRGMLASALRREPLQVDTAADGAVALEKIITAQYAVVLLDLMMPRMSGYVLLDELRRRRPARQPIVIVMTAFDERALMSLNPEQVHASIRKPFDLKLVAELVRDAAQLMQAAGQAAGGDCLTSDEPSATC